MLTTLYSIYDIKSRIYESPKFCMNEETAKRLFIVIFQNEKTMYNRFSRDYQVFEIGTFDDETCVMVPKKPEYKWLAYDLIRKPDASENLHLQENQNQNKTTTEKEKTQ